MTGDNSDLESNSEAFSERYRYEQSLLYRLSRLQRVTRALLHERVGELGLNIPEHSALLVVRERAPITNADLARASYVSAQTMIVVVSELEARGLVRRVPLGTGRSLMIELTDSGEAVVERLEEIHSTLASELVRDTRFEADDLSCLLRDMCANVTENGALSGR